VVVVISKMLKVVAAVVPVGSSLKQAVTSCPSSSTAQSTGSPHTDKGKNNIFDSELVLGILDILVRIPTSD
jgi:hypothetical protein